MIRHAREMLRRWALAGSAATLLATGTLRADEPSDAEVNDIKARVEALEKANTTLLERLKAQQESRTITTPDEGDPAALPSAADDSIKKGVDDYFKSLDAKKKQADEQKKLEEKCNGYEIGTDTNLRAFWNPDFGFTVETAHKDFSFHIGGWVQMDSVWWNQPAKLKPATQEGTLEDGVFFRRVALQLNGVAWDNIDYNLNYAFDSFGGPTTVTTAGGAVTSVVNRNPAIGELQDCWIQIRDMPWIGSVRIGQMRVPQGIEGDLVSNPRDMTFLERASFTDAFYNNFAPGLWVGNHVLNDRATWAAMAYRQAGGTIKSGGVLQLGAADGAAIGDDNWAYSARLTALPVYENEGRCLVHLGANVTYKSALANTVGAPVGPRFVDFAARPEMRDTIGGYQNVGPGDGNACVDTGLIQCNNATIPGFEFFSVLGPLTLQSEASLAYANDATAVTPPGGATLAFPAHTLGFWGGYVQVAYFLTGENRQYDRRFGALKVSGVRPYSPFFFKFDRSGGICQNLGALELAARYSYLNLNDGPVQGGVLGSTSIGLNWYLNPNLKIQFEYLNTNRWDIGAGTLAAPGNISGATNSFGIRTQLFF